MTAYIIALLFSVVTLLELTQKKKEAVSIIVLYLFCAPCVAMLGRKLDSTYVFIVVVFLALIVSKKGRVLKIRAIKSYASMMFVWGVLFSLGWIINSRLSSFAFVISLVGLVKAILLVYLLMYSAQFCQGKKEFDIAFGNGLYYSLVANGIAVFLQWLIPIQMYRICYNFYYSSDSAAYTSLESMDSWGGGFYVDHYYRYFGLFETPMVFSCFCIIVVAFVLIQFSSDRVYFKYPKIIMILAIALGVSAQCKIFFFMIPILIVLYVLYNSKKLTTQKMVVYLVISILGFGFMLSLDQLSKISSLRYLSYLADPISAFATRFGDGSESGFISKTLSIAMENFMTGVGPISIAGEPLSDSSYVTVLHHGGIIAVVALFLFYFRLYQINKNESSLNIMLLAILAMGVSRTILISGSITVLVVAYLSMNKKFNV